MGRKAQVFTPGTFVDTYTSLFAGSFLSQVLFTQALATQKIVAIMGQSNAEGKSDYRDLTDQTLVPSFSAVRLKQQLAVTNSPSSLWDTYATGPTVHRDGASSSNCGGELTLARYLNSVLPGKFDLVKIAVGSSNLNTNWRPGVNWPGSGQPNLCAQAIAYLQAAENELGGKIAAIIWVQGEADATSATDSAAYETNLTALIAAIRAVFPGVPFIFNRLSSTGTQTYNADVRTAQTNVDANVSGTTMVDCDGVAMKVDNLHFTADGYQELFRRFALAVLAALGINVPPVADFSTNLVGSDVTCTNLDTDADGSIASRTWSFGDGATSTAANPTHTYAASGTYQISHTCTDNSGQVSATVVKSVTVVNATWEIDATSSKAFPETAQHWTDLFTNYSLTTLSVPDALWLMQETSGTTFADVMGAFPLTITGSPSLAQAVTGWTKKAWVTTDGNSSMRGRTTSASLPNVTSESMAVLIYVAVTATPATARGLIGFGLATNDVEGRVQTTPAFQARSGSSTSQGGATNISTTVHPVLLVVNRTAGSVKMYTDSEKLNPTLNTGLNGQGLDIGATRNAAAPAAKILCGAMWKTAKAEAFTDVTAKSFLQALAWSPSWT